MRSTSPDNRLLVSQTRKWKTRRRLWRNVLEGCAREGEPRCAAIESLELHPPLILESRVLSGLCVLGRLLGTNVIATSVRRTHVAAMAPKQKKHQKSQEAAAAGAGILQLNRKENWTQLHIVLASWGVLPSK
ncbi:unnamed protein product [Sphagnum troendelagicum]